MQTQCFWPSGKEIRRLSIHGCLEVLASFGVEDVDGLRKSEMRELIADLKRQSHDRGDCDCPSAAYIREGGGRGLN